MVTHNRLLGGNHKLVARVPAGRRAERGNNRTRGSKICRTAITHSAFENCTRGKIIMEAISNMSKYLMSTSLLCSFQYFVKTQDKIRSVLFLMTYDLHWALDNDLGIRTKRAVNKHSFLKSLNVC